MTTIGRRRRYLTGDSTNELEDDHTDMSNSNPPLINKRRVSATADFASHRLIVSERQQLAVLKQLTASDETNAVSSPSSSIHSQPRSMKVFRRNEHGETIVHIAARKGDLKQLKQALKDGANVNEEDNAGWTPLHEAVTKNQFKAASLLLKSGANVNASGPDGQTPLIDAVLNNNIKIVELLLNYSADPSVVDLSRLNETMIKVLKREITIFDISDHENDEESLSPSSPLHSLDELEQDEKNLSEASSTSVPKVSPKTMFQNFREQSSDSSSSNKPSINENDIVRKNPYHFESDEDNESIKETKSNFMNSTNSNDLTLEEHSTSEHEHNDRVPPLRISLARNVSQHNESTESSNMDDNSSMECSMLPIIEPNENFLSTIITSTEVTTEEKEQEENVTKQEENSPLSAEKTNLSLSTLDSDQPASTERIISTIIDHLLSQIESNLQSPSKSVKDDNVLRKNKQGDSKQTTRTLRSHARGKLNFSMINSNLPDRRHVSKRRLAPEKKSPSETYEKPPRKKTISERSSTNEASNHSDEQTIDTNHGQTSSLIDRLPTNEDTNIGGEDDDSSSAIQTKQIHTYLGIDSLPPNKRRLREQSAAVLTSTDASNTTEENVPIDTPTREIPINGIKQFLDIRQQIEKRHEAMLHEFVLPKVPKDFAETLMAKKNYLLTPSYKSFSITTPAALGIKRLNPPSELDIHLSDVFTRQEDERYRMKLRHQVEREKLILSHEQEVLRLYGNATRSSINQEIPFSYCSLLKDNEVYNNPSIQARSSLFLNNDYPNTELGKRGKHRWNGRSFLKWLDDSNHKYKRLSCEINQRQHLEANTLYSMQRMVWLKQLPKETSSSSGRLNSLLSERYLPKVEINTNFWTHWEGNSI